MTHYQKTLAQLAPDMDPVHMETLAYMIGSTLNGMPREFFAEIAHHARRIGAEKLAKMHNDWVGA